MGFLFLLRALGIFRADGAPPFVRGIGCPRTLRAFSLLRPIVGEGGGRSTEGCVREAAPPVRGALLVLFSRQGEKSTHIHLPDKSKLKARRWIQPSAGFHYVLSMISLPLQRYTSNTPVCFPLIFSGREAGFCSFSSMAVRAASSSGSWYSHSMGAEDILR